MSIVGSYRYPSQSPNREIDFFRPGTPSTIEARLYSLNPAGQQTGLLATLAGESINVEMNSTSQKAVVARMIAAKMDEGLIQGRIKPDKTLSKLTLPEQNALLGSLAPHGTRKLDIDEGVGVMALSIFDPS